MATIHLGFNNNGDIKKLHLENIDLSNKIEYIKTEAKKLFTIQHDPVLVHCGNILNEDDTLINAGISSGAYIHCIQEIEPPAPITLEPFDLIQVQHLLVSIRKVVNNSAYRTFMQKIKSPETMEKIFKACPFMQQDPSALSFLQDPDLFQSLGTPSELNKIIEKRPVVGHLIQYLTTLLPSDGIRTQQISYSLDALSDDEDDMDVDQSEDSNGDSRASGSMPHQTITPGQLAAALANATGGSGPSRSSRSIPTTPSSATTPFNTPGPPSASADGSMTSPGMITSEMFSQALQNALAASASRSSGSSTNMPMSSNSAGPGFENLEESLQLMREMGIGDEQMCLQALQATNGDVEAAVNIILTQLLADD